VPLPPGYRMEWSGEFGALQDAKSRLAVIVPLSLILILALLYALFNSVRDSLIALSGIPFAVSGGILGLYVAGLNLSVSAAVGFISLFGVAVMSGVLYISDVNRRRVDPQRPLAEAIVAAARTQFRPILMLILVAMLGMMPAALARGIGSDIQRPLATVVVGGLISTLLLTLVALPAVYRLAAKLRSA
jgi:cobalt-zinc-cadmium resistance protein CzcA